MKSLFKYAILFLTYGALYFLIECLWKHQLSDYRMFLLGGLMGTLIGLMNNLFTYDTDLLLQALTGSMAITLAEAVSGYQLNLVMGLGIWDYSSLPFSFVGGQVNLIFSFLWACLSILAIFLDDFLRMALFQEDAPYYKLFGKTIYHFHR